MGCGPQESALRAMAPHARFEPPRAYARMEEFYRELDLFVLPSIPVEGMVEQFGFVLIEAMACGLPVIATRVGGIPEVVGDAAELVPPGNSSALGDSIRSLLQDESRRKKFALLGRERALRRFRREDVADKMRGVYREYIRS